MLITWHDLSEAAVLNNVEAYITIIKALRSNSSLEWEEDCDGKYLFEKTTSLEILEATEKYGKCPLIPLIRISQYRDTLREKKDVPMPSTNPVDTDLLTKMLSAVAINSNTEEVKDPETLIKQEMLEETDNPGAGRAPRVVAKARVLLCSSEKCENQATIRFVPCQHYCYCPKCWKKMAKDPPKDCHRCFHSIDMVIETNPDLEYEKKRTTRKDIDMPPPSPSVLTKRNAHFLDDSEGTKKITPDL